MKNKVFLALVICLVGNSLADNDPNWIEQWGIRWTFDKPITKDGTAGTYQYGQFANGDFWVVGPVRIVDISPNSFLHSNGNTYHGSMLNPLPTSDRKQGYGQCAGTYDASLNVAYQINSENPLVVYGNSSLVSTISFTPENPAPNTSIKTGIKTAAVLTILDTAAPSGSFRPGYCGAQKTVKYNKSQLNYSLLKNLLPVAGTPPLSYVEKLFEKPWIDHVPTWVGRYSHPYDSMPEYGRDLGRDISIGALMLHLNFTQKEKETLLIRYVQLGIDLYSIIENGGGNNWAADGGHAGGRKWPILFAGLMLNDPDMKAIGKKSGDYLYINGFGPGNPPSDYIHFGEDDQTFYVTQLDVNATNSIQWKPDSRDIEKIPYTSNDLGLPEWGIRHHSNPNYSNKWLPTEYRGVAGPVFHGPALAALFMDAKSIWNHDAYFDYTDRYMQFTSSTGEYAGWWRSLSVFTANMWDAYRNDYGPSWPNNLTLKTSAEKGSGSIMITPSKNYYTRGDIVTLEATASKGYKFSHWSGDISGTTNPYSLNMNCHKVITANFIPISPTEGQVFHAPLDDNSGTTVTDANSLQTGSLINGPLWGTGWRDEDWLTFNQSSQAITIPTMGMSPQAGTIAVWVTPTDFSGMKFIFGHTLNNTNRLSLYTAAGSLAVGLGSKATLKTNITTLPLGQPVHLALSWNGKTYTVYVNGEASDTGIFSGLTALNTFIDIGNYGNPAYRTLGFIGKIDDIRTYNRDLTAEEINALYLTHNIRQGKQLQFTVNAVNPQGIPIIYQAESMPVGASFDPATQLVTWTPWYNQLGLYTFRFTAAGQTDKVVRVEVHPSSLHRWYTLAQEPLPKIR